MSTRTTQHYVALDGLRGLAAISVVALHVLIYFKIEFKVFYTHLAVDFFFLLSGFVIAHAYDKKLTQGMDVYEFMKVRLIRLYPLIIIGVLLGTAIFIVNAIVFKDVTASEITIAFASALLLIPTTAMAHLRSWSYPLNGPLWSLSFEIIINFLYVLAFPYLTKTRLYAIAIIGAVLLAVAAYSNNGLNAGFSLNDFHLGFVRVLYPFTVGVIIKRYIIDKVDTGLMGLISAPILLIILFLPGKEYWSIELVSVIVIFPVILILAAKLPEMPILDKVWKPLGTLSYPLYVTHFPFVVAMSNLVKKLHLSVLQAELLALICFCLTIIFAHLINKYYDVPVRNFLNLKFKPA